MTAAPSGWIGGAGAPTTIPAQRIDNVPRKEWPFIQGPPVPAAQGTAVAGFGHTPHRGTATAGMGCSSADAGAAFVASPLAPDFAPLYKTNAAAARGGAAPGPAPSSAANLASAHGGAGFGHAPSRATASGITPSGAAAFGHAASSAANLAGANKTQKSNGGGFEILSAAAQVVDGACEIVRKEMSREQL